MRSPQLELDLLRRLAHAYRVQTGYHNIAGQWQEATPEALLHVLRALGAELASPAGAADALRARSAALWECLVQPVTVLWDGAPAKVQLRVPEHRSQQQGACTLLLENGEREQWALDLTALVTLRTMEVEGQSYHSKRLVLPRQLPWGYHRLLIELPGQSAETLLIVAPAQAWSPPERSEWGLFMPLYALRSSQDWGVGDLSALNALITWAGARGANVVGTLPLSASFLREPFEPSPYAPASRLFWNELFLDITSVPELQHSQTGQTLMTSAATVREAERLRSMPLVDYQQVAALKRSVLEELAHTFLSQPSQWRSQFRRYLEQHPTLQDYARFRATEEREAGPWLAWPERQRGGTLHASDFDDTSYQYHLYVQWLAAQQIDELAATAQQAEVQLYFDLPLGVHYNSYDVWRERGAFELSVAGGAPPDDFFTGGQNWGFPPYHPTSDRAQGYRYYRAVVRNYLQHAGILRIDHVMGLHRLFWIPSGMSPQDGVYVRYPAEELYAILLLESHRYQTRLIGENLGTVPPYVNAALQRHNIGAMYVGQFSLTGNPQQGLAEPLDNSLASMNTHDTPTFAGFWRGKDTEDRVAMGLLEPSGAMEVHTARQLRLNALTAFLRAQGWLKDDDGPAETLAGCLRFLAASPAHTVLINLEDLWLEELPQNVPGTSRERPNWQRRARLSLEEFTEREDFQELLNEIATLRQAVPRE